MLIYITDHIIELRVTIASLMSSISTWTKNSFQPRNFVFELSSIYVYILTIQLNNWATPNNTFILCLT